MACRESDVRVGDRVLRVRDAGDSRGQPVLYFHGTPGSRLDLSFGDDVAAEEHVRLVSFDRPGYGRSTAAPFGLSAVARDAVEIAAALELGRFATLGLSGGGPFALATAASPGQQVTRVGVASGPGPFQQVPGAIEQLDDNDRQALTHLPQDLPAAAAAFGQGFEELAGLFRDGDDEAIAAYFEPMLSPRDKAIMDEESFRSSLNASAREGLRPGVMGGGWDNVAWVGEWDVDLGEVRCPALLWYGEEDRFAPLAHGQWLQAHLPDSQLIVRPAEGHFGLFDHLGEALRDLTA
jgi:pimeloyl-ACP methyl ester carboxylesterase